MWDRWQSTWEDLLIVAVGPGPGWASQLHSTLLVHCSQGGLQGAAFANRTQRSAQPSTSSVQHQATLFATRTLVLPRQTQVARALLTRLAGGEVQAVPNGLCPGWLYKPTADHSLPTPGPLVPSSCSLGP